MNLVLIGFKKCGKTTTGKLLAKKTNRPFIDIDEVIESLYSKEGHPLNCREIHTRHGEAFFRHLEQKALVHIKEVDHSIIATGGGSTLSQENCRLLKRNGMFVYLKTAKTVLKERIFAEKTLPTILDLNNPEKSFAKHYQRRSPIYEKVADRILDTSAKSQHQVVQDLWTILQALR